MLDNEKKNLLSKIVKTFASYAKIDDEKIINEKINQLSQLNIDEAIDNILVSLNKFLKSGLLNQEDILSNVNLILNLNKEKYKTSEDLINRLKWLRGMNLDHPKMSLSENHKLIIEVFDKFNSLIQNKFDCYYTGGLMGYLATNQELERYHSDLDLFINEEQLVQLKNLIDGSNDFQFISNMHHKEKNGHEYKISYKGKEMSIGLFLFNRNKDQSIIAKEYYVENNKLYVDEHYLSLDYTNLCFSNNLREHNNYSYRMMSLESIYNAKKNGRPKDQYDANKIKNYIDPMVDYKIDFSKKNNFNDMHKEVNSSIIHLMEQIIMEDSKVNIDNFNQELDLKKSR